MWATGMCSLVATSAAAMVEFTSPTTLTMRGWCSRNTFSSPIITLAVCTAWEPEPTPKPGKTPEPIENLPDTGSGSTAGSMTMMILPLLGLIFLVAGWMLVSNTKRTRKG